MDNIITLVLGFDLNVEIKDQNDEPIKKGAKTNYPCIYTDDLPQSRILDISFFTHYNEDHLNRVRRFRKIND